MNNKNAFIRKESNSRFGFKVASEILRHDQHTAIPEGRIRKIQFFGLRTLQPVAILSHRPLEAVNSVSTVSLPMLHLPCTVLHECMDAGPATIQV